MKLLKRIDKGVAKFHWDDLGLSKLSAAALALCIAKLWPPLLNLDWYWYLVIAVVLAYKPACKICCKTK